MGRAAEAGRTWWSSLQTIREARIRLAIIEQILVGLDRPERAVVEPDRRLAIRKALEAARPGDMVLILGKGHESGQQFRDRTIPFDDRRSRRRCWSNWASRGPSVPPRDHAVRKGSLDRPGGGGVNAPVTRVSPIRGLFSGRPVRGACGGAVQRPRIRPGRFCGRRRRRRGGDGPQHHRRPRLEPTGGCGSALPCSGFLARAGCAWPARYAADLVPW